jgi:hypothetical protein
MKKILLSLLLINSSLFAQVNLQPNGSNGNLIFDMKQNTGFKDKTFVLPRNTIIKRTEYTNVNTTDGKRPESSLLIYNNVASTDIDKGPYYWYNLNETSGVWTPLVSSKNGNKLINLNYLTNLSNGKITDTYSSTNAPASGSWTNNIGDDITTKRWQEIVSYNTEIEIFNSSNIINLKLGGFVEAYDVDGVASQPNMSYELGIFVDNKLAVYSPLAINGNSNKLCIFSSFNVVGLLENLSVGKHTIRVAAKNRNILSDGGTGSNTAANVSYNDRNPNCINTNSNNTDRYLPNTGIQNSILSIHIQENPSILK